MFEFETSARLYYSSFYDPYKDECYLLYVEGNGKYICLPNQDATFRVIDKPTFEVNDTNVDTYASCRGFEKVLHFYSDNGVEWFNGFDNPQKKAVVRQALSKMAPQIADSLRYGITFSAKSHLAINNIGRMLKVI